MRRPIEKLALMLVADLYDDAALDQAVESGESPTIGELAMKYGETCERIMDALDVVRMIAQGRVTYLPYPGKDLTGKPIKPWSWYDHYEC